MANPEQLAYLKKGVAAWNAWRETYAGWIDLNDIALHGIDAPEDQLLLKGYTTHLAGINLANAELWNIMAEGVDLSGANLREANLFRANLRRANLSGADLTGADLYEADLYQADLSGAKLVDVRLTRARLVETNLCGAHLEGCEVYGVAAWELVTDAHTIQKNLIISDSARTWETPVLMDDLEVAQYILMLRSNPRIRAVLDAVTAKTVLILGRFNETSKPILDALREALRDLGFVPILFDFPPSPTRDLTETIQVLAGMARFIIADLSEAKSLPQELGAIIPHFPSIPVLPILRKGEVPYGMFEHWTRYRWVLPVFTYRDQEHLIASLEEELVAAAAIWKEEGNVVQLLKQKIAELEEALASRSSS